MTSVGIMLFSFVISFSNHFPEENSNMAGGLDPMISQGPFQPNSVILQL